MGAFEEIERNGFVLLPNGLSFGSVSLLREALDRIGSKKRNYGIRNVAAEVPEIRQLADSEFVRALLKPFFDREPFLVQSIFFDKTSTANWKVGWHQDLTIPVMQRLDTEDFGPWTVKSNIVHVHAPESVLQRMLIVRIHMDDTGASNGALRVLPGSHVRKMPEYEIAEMRTLSSAAVTCELSEGGVLLMRPLLLHSSSAAQIASRRRVIHLEYAADSLPGGLQWRKLDT